MKCGKCKKPGRVSPAGLCEECHMEKLLTPRTAKQKNKDKKDIHKFVDEYIKSLKDVLDDDED